MSVQREMTMKSMLMPRLQLAYKRPDEICAPDYITASDYLRPTVAAFVLASGYCVAFTLLCILLSPDRWVELSAIGFSAAFGMGVLYASMALVSSATHHCFLRFRVRKYGTDALVKRMSLPMKSSLSFELALAATGDLPNCKIAHFDEASGQIRGRIRGSMLRPARWVDLAVTDKASGSELSIATYAEMEPLRGKAMYKLWGPKWYSVIVSMEVDKNVEINNQIAAFIKSTPNWDHEYLALELDDQKTSKDIDRASA